MNIGVCVSYTDINQIDRKFGEIKKNGFDYCQLVAWMPSLWTDENAEIIKDSLKKHDVKISAFWCGWTGPAVWDFYEGPITLGLIPPEYRQMRIEQLCHGADFAKKLGVTDVVTHMGFIPESPNDPAFAPFCVAVRTVADHLKANGQWILFETGQETPVAMMRCFEKVGRDNLGVNLDTANLILYGKANPVDALDVLGKYVRNLHAKDGLYPVNGHDLGAETKIGEGKVDFKGVISKLHSLGYCGHITIEREIEGEQQTKDILESKKYLQKIVDEVCK